MERVEDVDLGSIDAEAVLDRAAMVGRLDAPAPGAIAIPRPPRFRISRWPGLVAPIVRAIDAPDLTIEATRGPISLAGPKAEPA